MPLSPASIESFLQDASGYHGEADKVFLPDSQDELEAIVRDAANRGIPLTVAGAGTGLTGARVPHGGYVISLDHFRQLEIEQGRARCGTGVLLKDLQQAAGRTHQFFGPNPTEDSASIGGIVCTNAGGARSFKYQSVRHQVLALDVTFADGRTEHFRRGDKIGFDYTPVRSPATTKNSAGYCLRADLDWVDLLAGSEGTLGIVTGVELKLVPAPKAILSGVVFFDSEENALEAVDDWRSIRELRLLEFMDGYALRLLRSKYDEIPPPANAALLIEQNLESEDDEEVDRWAQRLTDRGAAQETSWFGFREADHVRFREFRHTLAEIVTDTAHRNGFPKCSTDFAVPLGRYRELHSYYKRRCAEALPGQFTIFGHIGDANNHVTLLPRTPEQARVVEDLIYEFAEVVVSMGGTVAAEHGIGKTKLDLLKLMYSPGEVDSMRSVKQHLDPAWLLGRGTLFE